MLLFHPLISCSTALELAAISTILSMTSSAIQLFSIISFLNLMVIDHYSEVLTSLATYLLFYLHLHLPISRKLERLLKNVPF